MTKKGYKRTKEHQQKINTANTGKKRSKKARKNISARLIGNTNGSGRKGLTHTEETKKKMSRWHKNKKLSEEHRKKLSDVGKLKVGSKNPFYGKKHTKETKRKIGLAEMGEKNANWRGGKSFEPYGIEFNNKLREQIRERDRYTCQECNYTQKQLGRTLSIHHIDFNKNNNNPKNLISLCNACHQQTQFDREKWTKYFQDKIEGEIGNRHLTELGETIFS